MFGPYLWYPSFDNIDTNQLHEEADYLHSQCEKEGVVDGTKLTNVHANSEKIAYILELSNKGLRNEQFGIRCSEGVSVSLWDDWWVGQAGLYIVREGQEFPSYLYQISSHLGGRVYRWHDDG